jgi:hypothetical protein
VTSFFTVGQLDGTIAAVVVQQIEHTSAATRLLDRQACSSRESSG